MDAPLPGAVPELPAGAGDGPGSEAAQAALRHALAQGAGQDDASTSGDFGPSLEAFRVRREPAVPTTGMSVTARLLLPFGAMCRESGPGRCIRRLGTAASRPVPAQRSWVRIQLASLLQN